MQYDVPDGPNRDEDIQDVSAELCSARLRLGQRVNIGMPVAGKPDTHVFGMGFSAKSALKKYIQMNCSVSGSVSVSVVEKA